MQSLVVGFCSLSQVVQESFILFFHAWFCPWTLTSEENECRTPFCCTFSCAMEDIDNEILIFEISKHEALYNTDCDYYRDNVHKQMTWMQVCQVVVENGPSPMCWEKINQEERARICRQLQKRWKCLKTAFSRSVRAPKRKVNSRKYFYAKQMSFFLPFVKCIQTSEKTCDSEEKEQTLQPTSGTESNSSREEINIPFGERINEAADVLEIKLEEETEDRSLATHGRQNHLLNSNACVESPQFVLPNISTESGSFSEVMPVSPPKRQKVPEVMRIPSPKRKKIPEVKLIPNSNVCVEYQQTGQPSFSSEVMCLPSSKPKRQKVSEGLPERKSSNVFEGQKQANHAVQPCLQGTRSVEVYSNSSSTSCQSEYESDKLFLMSLLPTITKLNELDKLDFKSEVIQILKCFARSSS